MAKTKEKEKVKVTKKKTKAVEGGDLVVANAKKSVTEQLTFGIDMNAYLDSVIEVVEKKTKISSQNMMRYAERISTGILALDMYLDGGIVAGGWYTFAGGEQSCKSTLAMCIAAALIKQNFRGTTSYFDYEGSADEQYAANQLKTLGVKINPQEIFGVKDDETGEWLIRPRIRYYAPDNGEKFFDYMSGLRRRLPDKVVEKDGKAFFVFENTQENRKLVGSHFDKKWFSAHNQFKVPAPDAHMQSLTLVDSYPAMMPDQVDDDEGSKAMALQARMFSDGIKRFRGGMRRKMMTIIGINQLRQKPATMFGSPEYEPCGDALKFYSDVRLRMASRAVPQGWPVLKDAPGIVGEDSVTHPGGIDRYRFIAIRTIKNKMGGIPNQTTWVRLWESDGKGEARGFDPVFDTWHYMKTIGLITGTRNRIKFTAPCPLASKVAIDWQEFRTLINGNKEQITKICKKMDVKPNSLRAWCFKFIVSPKGREMLRASIIAKGKSSSDDGGDDD